MHIPMYWLSIECPKCKEDIEILFLETGRYEFAPDVPDQCEACGYANEAELTRLALDANDAGAEKYWTDVA